jgi:hypothetical protein
MRALLLLLVTILASPALASDGSGDASGDSAGSSEGSGDSSKGSGDSSNASGDSSNNSNDSSNGSSNSEDDSFANSSEESSKESTEGSSDSTSRGDGARTFTIAAAIVIAAGGIAAAIGFGVSTTQRNEAEAEQKLSKFLRRHHSAVVHDVALARGPILEGWAAQWGFDQAEVDRFLTELDGSEEQLAMVELMSRLDDPAASKRFAVEMYRVMERTFGPERVSLVAATL